MRTPTFEEKSLQEQMLPPDDDACTIRLQLAQETPKTITTTTATTASSAPTAAALLRRKSCITPAAKFQRMLTNRLEILNWIGAYNTEWALNDLIAGVTLGLTIIPESIACALLAGLPASYGLCSAFVGSFVYLIFGSISKVIIGPTSLVALVSLQFTVGKPVEFAILLTFLTGVVELLMGTLRAGVIFEFLSVPVIKAFSSATAILVIESQIKVMLGVKYLVSGFIGSVATLASRIGEANMGDLVMGVCAVIFLIVFAKLEKLADNYKVNSVVACVCRYLSFSRNTLIVLIAAIVSYVWMGEAHSVPYALSVNALSGLPNISLPDFSVSTAERTYTFTDMLAELNVAIVVIPIVGILTNISIGKLACKGLVDANKELITVGLCNIAGSCMQSMPVSGAFTRYAISDACGLKTPMANLYSGIIVLLALSFLSPYFNYIPEATLAAILMCSIVTLLDLRLPLRLWRDAKRDFCVWLLCFTVCVLRGVEVGLLVSIIVTVLHLLFLWAHPDISARIDEMHTMQFIRITPVGIIYFPAINHLRAKVLKVCARTKFQLPIVIDCQKLTGLDFTAALGIAKLPADLRAPDSSDDALPPVLVLHRLPYDMRRLIDATGQLVFSDSEEQLADYMLQQTFSQVGMPLKVQTANGNSSSGISSECGNDCKLELQ